jgi:uncharacterized protein YchJ
VLVAIVRANCDALVESGCIDALGAAALDASVQDAVLSVLRDVDGAALVRSDVVTRFVAAINGEVLPLPKRAVDVAPPLSSTPVLDHEKREWPTTVTVVDAEPLWYFLLAHAPPGVLLGAGFIGGVTSFVHRSVRTKSRALLEAVFAHFPLRVLVEQRLPHHLFLMVARRASDVLEAVPKASQRSAGADYVEQLAALENQYRRRESAVPGVQAAIESDVRAIDRYGGPHTDEYTRVLLSFVALLDDSDLVEPQYGWAGAWNKAPAELMLSGRASIVDLAIGMLATHTQVVNELVAIFLKLSSETLARHGVVVRVMAIARSTSVPVAVVLRCLELLGPMSSAYLLERDVFDVLFSVVVSRHTSFAPAANLARFDLQLTPTANEAQFAALTSASAPHYADLTAAALLLRRRLLTLLTMSRWRARHIAAPSTTAQSVDNFPVYDTWPGALVKSKSLASVPSNALMVTIVPSKDASNNVVRVLYCGEPGALERFTLTPPSLCACRSGKLGRDCCEAPAAIDVTALLGQPADDVLVSSVDETRPSLQSAAESDLLRVADGAGGTHVINRGALLGRWACELSHVVLLSWDVLRHCATHVTAISQNYVAVYEAPPLPGGSKLSAVEISGFISRTLVPIFSELAQLARDFVDSFDFCKLLRVAWPTQVGSFTMNEYAPSVAIEAVRVLWNNFQSVVPIAQSHVQHLRNMFLQLCSMTISLLKLARCVVKQMVPSHEDELTSAALRLVEGKFAASELEQHDALGKLFKHWRTAPLMRYPMQRLLLGFVVKQPSEVVWRSSFISLVCDLLKTNTSGSGYRGSLLSALTALLRTDPVRAERLLLGKVAKLGSASLAAQREQLFAQVVSGLANIPWSTQANLDMPFFFEITQLVSTKKQRRFWLQPPASNLLSWPQGQAPRALLHVLVDHLLCRAAVSSAVDPLMRVAAWVASLAHLLKHEIVLHVFTTVLAIGVVGSGQATLHNTASTIEWMANRYVQSISPKAAPYLVPGPNRQCTLMSFPCNAQPGAALWFDTAPHWLTHVFVERSARSPRMDVIAVYQLLHEVPDDEAALPPSDAERDAMPMRERGARQRVRWSTGRDALPTAVTHASDDVSLVTELELAHVPSGGWAARVYPPADAVLPRANNMTEFTPLLPTPGNVSAFAQRAGLVGEGLPLAASAAAAQVPVRDVRWYFADNDGAMQPFDVSTSHMLETAHRLQHKTANYAHKGATYTVNFAAMQQTNISTNRRRKILRAAWFEAADPSSPTESLLRPMDSGTADALEAAFITKRFETALAIGRASFMVFRDGTGFRSTTSDIAVLATGGNAVYRGYTERAMPTRFNGATRAAALAAATSAECGVGGHVFHDEEGAHAERRCVSCARTYSAGGTRCIDCSYQTCPTCSTRAPMADSGSGRRRRKNGNDDNNNDDDDDDDDDADDKSPSGSKSSKRKAKKAEAAAPPPPPPAPATTPSRVRLTLIGFVRVPANVGSGELVFDPPVFCHNVVLQTVTDRAMSYKHARVFGIAADVTGEPPLKAGEVPLHQSVPLLASDAAFYAPDDENEAIPGFDLFAPLPAVPKVPSAIAAMTVSMTKIRENCTRAARDPLHVCNRKCATDVPAPSQAPQPASNACRPRNGLPVSHMMLPHWTCPCGSGEPFSECCERGAFGVAPATTATPSKNSSASNERCVCLSKLPYEQCCGRVAHLHAVVPSSSVASLSSSVASVASSSAAAVAASSAPTAAPARKEQALDAWNRWRSVLDYYGSTNRPLTGVFARLPLATSFAPVLSLGILRSFVGVDPEPLLYADLPTARVAPDYAQSELQRLAKLADEGDASAFARAVAGRAAYPLRSFDGHADSRGQPVVSRNAPTPIVVDVDAPCWVLHAPLHARAVAGWVFVWPRAVADESGKSMKKSRSKHRRTKKSRKAEKESAEEKERVTAPADDDDDGDDDDDDADAEDGKKKKEPTTAATPAAAAADASKVPRRDEIVCVPVTFVKDVLLMSDSEFKQAFNCVQKLQGRAIVDDAIAAVAAADATATASKPATQAPTPLPKGWRQYQTAQGRAYYYHAGTRLCQWARPTVEAGADAGAAAAASLSSSSTQGARATLLSQIAAGTTLKHVTPRVSTVATFGRESLSSSSASSDSYSGPLQSSGPLAQSAAALGYTVNLASSVPPPPPPADDAGDELGNKVVALYDYSGQDEGELSFVQGDVITVLEEDASGWWLGLILERQGYFPSNYCEPVAKKARTLFDIANEVPVTDVRAFRAAYKYVAMEPGEVSFSPGDDITVEQKNGDWWVGTVNGVTGRFPAIMVEPAPVSVGAPGESLDALLDELDHNIDLTASAVVADTDTSSAAAAASTTTTTAVRQRRLSVGRVQAAAATSARPPRLARSVSLDVLRPLARKVVAATPGAIAVPPPMPVGIIRPLRIKTAEQTSLHATAAAVQQHGDGLPLSAPVDVRPTTAPPPPPPLASPGEVVVPLDAETQRKYDQDAAVRLWYCQQALQPSNVGAFSGFVDVGVHDVRVEHCVVSSNWLLLFLAARKCNYMSSCAVPRGANGNAIACPHGRLVVHSLMELALAKARGAAPPSPPSYDTSITSISSETFFRPESGRSSRSSIRRNQPPPKDGAASSSSSSTTTAAAATTTANDRGGVDLAAVRERTRVMPKPCADLLGLHWSALSRLPLQRVEVRGDGEISDAALLASLQPCDECQGAGARRLADRDAYDRMFATSATSYAIVEGGWYQAWFKYIMDDLCVEPQPPHGIQNRTLFQPGTSRPRTNLVQARDYVPITRELWHHIAKHYDADCMIATKYSSIYSSGLTVEAIDPK